MSADLETGLRATLRGLPADVTADAGAVAEHVLTQVHAARHRRRRRAAVGAGAAVLAAAAMAAVVLSGGGHRSAVPADPNGCDQLIVAALGTGTSGGAERDLAISVRNDSDSVCRLPAGGPTKVGVFLGRRHRLDVVGVVPNPDSSPSSIEPGGEINIRAVWSNWCEGPVRAATVRVVWATPDGDDSPADTVTEPFQPSPTCRDHTNDSKLTVADVWVTEPGATGIATPSPAPSRPPDPDLLAAANRWSAAMDSYVACLREHGADVTEHDDFSLELGGPKLAAAQAACPPPKPSLVAGYDADEMWAALHPDVTHTPTPYPTNADGLTYGSGIAVSSAEPEDLPDLIAVESTGGTGYVYAYELEGDPQAWVTNPQQAQDYMNDPDAHKPRTLTAYKSDGVTVVGTFTTGSTQHIEPSTAP